jgi:hypothetical protein
MLGALAHCQFMSGGREKRKTKKVKVIRKSKEEKGGVNEKEKKADEGYGAIVEECLEKQQKYRE